MADIFVSYSSEDRERVEPLVDRLRRAGYSVWWDRHLQGGSIFSHAIEEELNRAGVVVVVWSKHSLESRWVADEAEIAANNRKLIPLVLDEVTSPIGFRQLQAIDFSNWQNGPDDECFVTLLSALRGFVEAEGSGQQERSTQESETGRSNIPHASIAVLPFVNMSSDPEQEYFSDGISEELLGLLSKIHQLHVTARTSSFQFKGKNLDISEIGQKLRVAHVLEGSVRKAGNRVRITAQLIEAKTGFHKWSESFDRDLIDIFAIQDEISVAIVEALKMELLGGEDAPVSIRSGSMKAYEAYLAGQQLIAKRTGREIEKAIEQFGTSVDLDSGFVPALVGLAESHLLLSNDEICYGRVPVDEALSTARPLLDRALGIDPESEIVHAALAFFHHLENNSELAQEHAEKAIELNSNCSKAYRILGLVLSRSANPRALVVTAREKTLRLDPASPVDLINLFGDLVPRRRYSESEALLRRIDDLDPGSVFADWGRFHLAWSQGRLKDCLDVYVRSSKLVNDRQWAFGIQGVLTLFEIGEVAERLDVVSAVLAYCRFGQVSAANKLMDSIGVAATSHFDARSPSTPALWHLLNNRADKAVELLTDAAKREVGEWGILYDLYDFCLGARLLWYMGSAQGQIEVAEECKSKLKELYAVRLIDHEGVHKVTHYIGACIANMEGDEDTALNQIQQYYEQSPGSSLQIFCDPLLQGLSKNARFLDIRRLTHEHIAAERKKAVESGLIAKVREILAGPEF